MDSPDIQPPPLAPPRRLNWILLIAFLIGPAALTALAVLIDSTSNSPAPGVGIIGGLLGGIGCGALLGHRLGRSTGMKILLGIILGAGCVVASVTIAMFGCLASGFSLNLH